jgi:hypothetical protein
MSVKFDKLSPGAAELYRNDPLTRILYPMGDKLFTAPHRTAAYVRAKTGGANQTLLRKYLLNPALNSFNWLVQKFVDYDYKNYVKVGKFQLSRPSNGAFAMMLFPFTIIPRLFQAIKRSENGDRSEFYDILRRDIPTIAILLYALDPLQKFLTKQMQKLTGVKLVGDEIYQARHATLSYSVDSEKALAAILREEGNKPHAVKKALDNIADRWLKALEPGSQEAGKIHELKKTVAEMIEAHGKKQTRTVDQLSAQGYKIVQWLEDWKAGRLKNLAQSSQKEIKNSFPAIQEFFARYAHTRRLPVDIFSFIVVCIGIGWLPVWFNDLWSRKKHAQGKGAPGTPAQPFNPFLTYDALKRSSRLYTGA